MSTPIFDAIATELGVLCPICGTAEILHGLIGQNEPGADLDVCTGCWERGRHWPDVRVAGTCVDCGKYPIGFDAMALVVGDGAIRLCRADFDRRAGIR